MKFGVWPIGTVTRELQCRHFHVLGSTGITAPALSPFPNVVTTFLPLGVMTQNTDRVLVYIGIVRYPARISPGTVPAICRYLAGRPSEPITEPPKPNTGSTRTLGT